MWAIVWCHYDHSWTTPVQVSKKASLCHDVLGPYRFDRVNYDQSHHPGIPKLKNGMLRNHQLLQECQRVFANPISCLNFPRYLSGKCD